MPKGDTIKKKEKIIVEKPKESDSVLINVPEKKDLPIIEPIVSIQPSRENDRKISVEFIIHANKIKYEDIKDITFQILKDAMPGVKKVIEEAVGQEQKFLDATRR